MNFSLGDINLRPHNEGGLQYNTVKSLKIKVSYQPVNLI